MWVTVWIKRSFIKDGTQGSFIRLTLALYNIWHKHLCVCLPVLVTDTACHREVRVWTAVHFHGSSDSTEHLNKGQWTVDQRLIAMDVEIKCDSKCLQYHWFNSCLDWNSLGNSLNFTGIFWVCCVFLNVKIAKKPFQCTDWLLPWTIVSMSLLGIQTVFHLHYVLNVATKASKLLPCLCVLLDPACPRCTPLLGVLLSLSFASWSASWSVKEARINSEASQVPCS